MRRLIKATPFVALALLVGASFAQAQETAMPWQVSLTGNYGSWKNTSLPQDGTQSQMQGQVSYETEQWGATLTGRSVATDYKTALADERFSVSTFTEPTLSTYYATELGAVSVRGGVDVVAGIGKRSYTSAEQGRMIFDPVATDLMIVNSYGAGTDVAPHLVAVWSDGATSFGFAARYTVTGDYDPTDDGVGNTYAPGDTFLGMINGGFTLKENHLLTFQALYITTTGDKLDGTEVFRSGDQVLGEVRYIGSFAGSVRLIVAGSLSTQGKNRIGSDGGTLAEETANSNNNAWELYTSVAWWIVPNLGLTGMVGHKMVAANGLGSDEALYDAGRTRTFIEPGFLWGVSDSLSLMGKLRYSRIEDKKDSFNAADSAYDVYNVDLAVVRRF